MTVDDRTLAHIWLSRHENFDGVDDGDGELAKLDADADADADADRPLHAVRPRAGRLKLGVGVQS